MQKFKEKKTQKKLQNQNHKQNPKKQQTPQTYYVSTEKKKKAIFPPLDLEMHTISKDPYE